jgi:hypothetical protein
MFKKKQERAYSSEQKLSFVRKQNNQLEGLHEFYSNQINSLIYNHTKELNVMQSKIAVRFSLLT